MGLFKRKPLAVFFERGIDEDKGIIRFYLPGSLGQKLVSKPQGSLFSCPIQVFGQEWGQMVADAVILSEGVAVPENTVGCFRASQFLTSPFRFPSASKISRCRGILPTAWVEQERQGS